jgi:cytosine deaminase
MIAIPSIFDTVLDHAVMPDGRAVSIGIAGGRIAAIEADDGLLGSALNRVDLQYALVIPGLVDGHVHLDTTFLGDTWRAHQPCSNGFSVAERLTIQKKWLKEGAHVGRRAAALIERAVACGTTTMRTHVEIDVDLGLDMLDEIVVLRQRYSDAISIQIVGLPRGLVCRPGTLDLMEEAMGRGVDIVGGVDPASFEGDVGLHLDRVFDLAQRFGTGVDLHLHDFGMSGIVQLDAIAERTRALGMQGKVAVAHAYALGSSPDHAVQSSADKLAEAGVAIMTNAPGNLPIPPVLDLRAAGVNVFAGNDDIRDSWWPYGDADMLQRAMLIGYRSGFYSDEELNVAFDLVTRNAAMALGVAHHGLRVGAAADLVALAAQQIPEAVVARPLRRAVFKAGRIVASDGIYRGGYLPRPHADRTEAAIRVEVQDVKAVGRYDAVFERARLPDGTVASIGVQAGLIAAISSDAPLADAKQTIDLGHLLVIPGLIDGHIHLDKSFIGESWKPHRPCTAGFDVRERVAFEKELLAGARSVEQRAAALTELAIARGTAHMRTHVDIDAEVGLRNLEAVLAIKERYRDWASIEVVAFPQSGILASPGTRELLAEAVASGADLIGGLDPAGFDRSIEGHLDAVFGVAERHGVGIDIHLHDPDMLGIFELEEISRRTIALGMKGCVAVSHAYALGQVSIDVARRTAAMLARAGIAIMTNAPGDRAFPPIRVLREAGVTVFAGNDNIRDSWWPYGDADMLERAMMIGYQSGFHTDEDLAIAFDMATASAASALRLPMYGLRPGAPANFIAIEARHIQEAVVARPAIRSVYRGGCLIARDGQLLENPPGALMR